VATRHRNPCRDPVWSSNESDELKIHEIYVSFCFHASSGLQNDKGVHMAPSRNFPGAPKCQSTDGVRNLGPWSRAKTIAPRNLKSAKSKHGPDPNEK
jgi:hypothetical protein